MDLYFGILVISILFGVLGMVVSGRLKRKFAYYSQVGIRSGMTGAQIAQKMLDDHGIHDVTIESVQGKLTDHYNPILYMAVVDFSVGRTSYSNIKVIGNAII
mgnify:CR=1 FL=1